MLVVKKSGWGWIPGSQHVLNEMDKGLKVEEVWRARRALGDAGIRACYFLQLGYPGETWDDICATAELVRTSHPDDIGVSVSYPLPALSSITKWNNSSARSATGTTATISA